MFDRDLGVPQGVSRSRPSDREGSWLPVFSAPHDKNPPRPCVPLLKPPFLYRPFLQCPGHSNTSHHRSDLSLLSPREPESSPTEPTPTLPIPADWVSVSRPHGGSQSVVRDDPHETPRESTLWVGSRKTKVRSRFLHPELDPQGPTFLVGYQVYGTGESCPTCRRIL